MKTFYTEDNIERQIQRALENEIIACEAFKLPSGQFLVSCGGIPCTAPDGVSAETANRILDSFINYASDIKHGIGTTLQKQVEFNSQSILEMISATQKKDV
jgi:hypothetical protein